MLPGPMPWIRRKLRGNLVYVKATATGEPAADARGLVEVRYKPEAAAKVYRAAAKNLEPTGEPDEAPIEIGAAPPSRGAPAGVGAEAEADAIIIYTDGACTGNPGPAGLGAVILDRGQRIELSEYLGEGTNNIAELAAIERALEAVPDAERDRPVVIHSDSSYSIGLLTRGWKAKANAELVARIRALAGAFPRLRFVKVPGHAGIPENERADALAREAIVRRR
jgi:ribonuclease HI